MVNTGLEKFDEFEVSVDEDISDEEKKFYFKCFPSLDIITQKRTHCTSCNVHLGTAPDSEDKIFMHPLLKVTQCKKCYDFYNSGEFSKGEDGSELYCRWCGQGGEVYCCAKCAYVFCKACITLNLSKRLVTSIRENENWNCFVCSPKITWPIRANHWALKNYIKKRKKDIEVIRTISNANDVKKLMRKDSSKCCPNINQESENSSESSSDSDTPLSTRIKQPAIKKRKVSETKSETNSSKSNDEASAPKLKKTDVVVPKILNVSSVASPLQLKNTTKETTLNTGSTTFNANQQFQQVFQINGKQVNMVELSRPREMVELSRPREIIEFSQPREIIELSQPREIIEVSRPRETIEVSRPRETIEVSRPRAMVELSRPREMVVREVRPYKAQHVNSVQGNHSAVKIVQFSQQAGQIQTQQAGQIQPQQAGQIQSQRSTIQMQIAPQQATPPPLLMRNRAVQIRPNMNISNLNPNVTKTNTTTVQLGVRQNSEQSPVYHNIAGFCIDLNSAAQHDSIRLPNGKLIQVKKSTTNNANNVSNVRAQIPSGTLSTIVNQPQHQFTITQSSGPATQLSFPNSQVPPFQPQTQNITVPPATIIQLQALANLPPAAPLTSSGKPSLLRNVYPNTPIGKARSQLQNQIFAAMDICQHLSSKLQTLTNSNPYKNASSSGDIKELYIHLSYLFTYGMGRLRSMQEKVAEDMTNLGFKTNVSTLVSGQLNSEKYSSDGDDEIEIVEPKTTTITLDSDNEGEDNVSIKPKTKNDDKNEPCTDDKIQNQLSPNLVEKNKINSLQPKVISNSDVSIHTKPVHTYIGKKPNKVTKPSQTPIKESETSTQEITSNLINDSQQEAEEDLSPFRLLAEMLEIELTEEDGLLKTKNKNKKYTKKKVIAKPSVKKICKIKYSKIENIKKSDMKLKQKCCVRIERLDKESLERFKVNKRTSETVEKSSNVSLEPVLNCLETLDYIDKTVNESISDSTNVGITDEVAVAKTEEIFVIENVNNDNCNESNIEPVCNKNNVSENVESLRSSDDKQKVSTGETKDEDVSTNDKNDNCNESKTEPVCHNNNVSEKIDSLKSCDDQQEASMVDNKDEDVSTDDNNDNRNESKTEAVYNNNNSSKNVDSLRSCEDQQEVDNEDEDVSKLSVTNITLNDETMDSITINDSQKSDSNISSLEEAEIDFVPTESRTDDEIENEKDPFQDMHESTINPLGNEKSDQSEIENLTNMKVKETEQDEISSKSVLPNHICDEQKKKNVINHQNAECTIGENEKSIGLSEEKTTK